MSVLYSSLLLSNIGKASCKHKKETKNIYMQD